MLVYKVYYNGRYEDNVVVRGDTEEEITENAYYASDSRGWERENCWCEKISG